MWCGQLSVVKIRGVNRAWPAGARKTHPVKNPVPGGYTEHF